MNKVFKSLPVRLLLGVVIGILAGLVANEGLMHVVVTLNYIMGQVISFCVPLPPECLELPLYWHTHHHWEPLCSQWRQVMR